MTSFTASWLEGMLRMKKRILVLLMALFFTFTTLGAYAKEDSIHTLLGIQFGVTKDQWLKAANKKMKSKMKFEDASDAYTSCCRTVKGNLNPDLLGWNVYEIAAYFTDDRYSRGIYQGIFKYLVKDCGEPLRVYFTIGDSMATEDTLQNYALLYKEATLDEAQFTQLFTQLAEKQTVRMHALWSNVEFTGYFDLGEGDKQLMFDANLKYYDKAIILPDIEILPYQ